MTRETQLFLAKSPSCSLSPGIQVRDTGADGSDEVSLDGPATVTLIIFVNPREGIVRHSICSIREGTIFKISFGRADGKMEETKGNTYF